VCDYCQYVRVIERQAAQNVMLRDALTKMVRNGQKQGWNDNYKADMVQSNKALAATADLKEQGK